MHPLNTEISEICFSLGVKFVPKTVKTFSQKDKLPCLCVPDVEDFYQVCK